MPTYIHMMQLQWLLLWKHKHFKKLFHTRCSPCSHFVDKICIPKQVPKIYLINGQSWHANQVMAGRAYELPLLKTRESQIVKATISVIDQHHLMKTQQITTAIHMNYRQPT